MICGLIIWFFFDLIVSRLMLLIGMCVGVLKLVWMRLLSLIVFCKRMFCLLRLYVVSRLLRYWMLVLKMLIIGLDEFVKLILVMVVMVLLNFFFRFMI